MQARAPLRAANSAVAPTLMLRARMWALGQARMRSPAALARTLARAPISLGPARVPKAICAYAASRPTAAQDQHRLKADRPPVATLRVATLLVGRPLHS